MPSDPIRVLLHVTELLDRIGTPYFLGGSLASSMLGEPRSTVDIDLAIVLRGTEVPLLVAALGSEFTVDEGAVRQAVEGRTSFNAIHQPTVLKVDFFVLGDTPFDRAQLEGRRLSPALEGSDRRVFVSSPEDLILRKLDGYRQGGRLGPTVARRAGCAQGPGRATRPRASPALGPDPRPRRAARAGAREAAYPRGGALSDGGV